MRVTSSLCITPKRDQQDQEPTPINRPVFKELATEPQFVSRSAKGANYTDLVFVVKHFFTTHLLDLKTTQRATCWFPTGFVCSRSSERPAFYRPKPNSSTLSQHFFIIFCTNPTPNPNPQPTSNNKKPMPSKTWAFTQSKRDNRTPLGNRHPHKLPLADLQNERRSRRNQNVFVTDLFVPQWIETCYPCYWPICRNISQPF